jgi:hypothetical protein
VSWSDPTSPNLPDYALFVSGVMDVSVLYLPPTSPFLAYAFDQALALVVAPGRRWWNWGSQPPGGIGYTLAVYNCAGHIQIRITPDQAQRTFFVEQRTLYHINKPSFGVVESTSDEGTSASLAVPDALKQLTLGDLDFAKTPWGREYLSYAQDFGGVWGIS